MKSKYVHNTDPRRVKYMQVLNEAHYHRLQRMADSRGLTVQEYVRIIVGWHIGLGPTNEETRLLKRAQRVKLKK